MPRVPFLKIALTCIVCAGCVTACGARRRPNVSPATPPTAPAVTAAARPTHTPAPQSDAKADAIDQSLQQLGDALSAVDTVDEAQSSAQEEAMGQSFQQLDSALSSTDTLTDLANK